MTNTSSDTSRVQKSQSQVGVRDTSGTDSADTNFRGKSSHSSSRMSGHITSNGRGSSHPKTSGHTASNGRGSHKPSTRGGRGRGRGRGQTYNDRTYPRPSTQSRGPPPPISNANAKSPVTTTTNAAVTVSAVSTSVSTSKGTTVNLMRTPKKGSTFFGTTGPNSAVSVSASSSLATASSSTVVTNKITVTKNQSNNGTRSELASVTTSAAQAISRASTGTNGHSAEIEEKKPLAQSGGKQGNDSPGTSSRSSEHLKKGAPSIASSNFVPARLNMHPNKAVIEGETKESKTEKNIQLQKSDNPIPSSNGITQQEAVTESLQVTCMANTSSAITSTTSTIQKDPLSSPNLSKNLETDNEKEDTNWIYDVSGKSAEAASAVLSTHFSTKTSTISTEIDVSKWINWSSAAISLARAFKMSTFLLATAADNPLAEARMLGQLPLVLRLWDTSLTLNTLLRTSTDPTGVEARSLLKLNTPEVYETANEENNRLKLTYCHPEMGMAFWNWAKERIIVPGIYAMQRMSLQLHIKVNYVKNPEDPTELIVVRSLIDVIDSACTSMSGVKSGIKKPVLVSLNSNSQQRAVKSPYYTIESPIKPGKLFKVHHC